MSASNNLAMQRLGTHGVAILAATGAEFAYVTDAAAISTSLGDCTAFICLATNISGTIDTSSGSAQRASFPRLTSLSGTIEIEGHAGLAAVDLDSLATVSSGFTINLQGSNLPTGEVDRLLHILRLAAQAGSATSGVISLSGGTSGAPTGGEICDADGEPFGSGYSEGDPVTFNGESGSGAAGTVSAVDGSGAVTAITITARGSGYTGTVSPVIAETPFSGWTVTVGNFDLYLLVGLGITVSTN